MIVGTHDYALHREDSLFLAGLRDAGRAYNTERTYAGRAALYCSATRPGSYADVTHARELGLVKLLSDGPAVEILADAGYQGLGAQTGGRVVTPPIRRFKKNAPDWNMEIHEFQRKAHSSHRIRVEHGIARLKNWWALARQLGRREHMDATVRAIAGLLSQQQTADRILAWQT
ncbi:transposase family protein [Streptomyces sp. NPDC056004]|uniref:transposase family protein n=1 Tax=Streptomyces sp. NPDC056004 TaxID=3345677 RepID=UPI0035E3B0EF